MRVLVAPDAFKGTMTAPQAAAVIAGVLERHGHQVDQAPIADGGDGTLAVFLAQGFASVEVATVDAALRPRTAPIAVRDGVAIVELAAACGIVTVADLPRDPWHASCLGLGLAAAAAVRAGASAVHLCLGGSASVDGGVGLLRGLGWRVLDGHGADVPPGLLGLTRATAIVGDGPSAGVTWTVLSDVANPLTGPAGAVVFAPQKGLSEADCVRVEPALASWADLLERTFGVDVRDLPGAGAAGGVGAAAAAALGASIVSGARTVVDLIDLRARIAVSDLVVTGEGRFDTQSVGGKGVGVVIELASGAGRPVHVVAGSAQPGVAAPVASVIGCVGPDAPVPADPVAALAAAAERLAKALAPPC